MWLDCSFHALRGVNTCHLLTSSSLAFLGLGKDMSIFKYIISTHQNRYKIIAFALERPHLLKLWAKIYSYKVLVTWESTEGKCFIAPLPLLSII